MIGRDHILPGLVSIGLLRHADQGGRRHCVLGLAGGWTSAKRKLEDYRHWVSQNYGVDQNHMQ
jgi:hypothetical protein